MGAGINWGPQCWALRTVGPPSPVHSQLDREHGEQTLVSRGSCWNHRVQRWWYLDSGRRRPVLASTSHHLEGSSACLSVQISRLGVLPSKLEAATQSPCAARELVSLMPIRPSCALTLQIPRPGHAVMEVSLPYAASHWPVVVFGLGMTVNYGYPRDSIFYPLSRPGLYGPRPGLHCE